MFNISSLKIINYKLRILSGQITNCADAEHLSVHSSLPWRPCRLATSSSPVTYSLSPRLTILLNNITTILLNTTISIFSSLSWSLVSTSAETLCQQSCIFIVLFGRVKEIAINLLYSLLFYFTDCFSFPNATFQDLGPS